MSEYYYYGLAAMMYVTTCLMFAAVRWFHVCPTTKEHKDYFYPARRVGSLVYLSFRAIFTCGSLWSEKGRVTGGRIVYPPVASALCLSGFEGGEGSMGG